LTHLKSTPNCIVASFKKVLEIILINSYKPLYSKRRNIFFDIEEEKRQC